MTTDTTLTDLPELMPGNLIRKKLWPISKRTFHRALAAGDFPPADCKVEKAPVLAAFDRDGLAGTAGGETGMRIGASSRMSKPQAHNQGGATDILLRDSFQLDGLGISGVPVIGKAPTVKWGLFKNRLPTDAERRNWFGPNSTATGLAIVCNEHVNCRDFDAEDPYYEWAETNPRLARELPTSKTPRGFHVFARMGVERIMPFGGEGELRGAGGITVIPHSLHPSGARYEWINPLPKSGRLVEVASRLFMPSGWQDDTADDTNGCTNLNLLTYSTYYITSADDAIKQTLPKEAGQRNYCLLRLARACRHNLKLTLADSKPVVKQWHQQALAHIKTEAFFDSWSDFCHAYANAKFPLGADVVTMAIEKAGGEMPPVASEYDGSPEVQKLISVCWALAQSNGGQFFIPCDKAGELIGRSSMHAWRYLNALEADGVIRCVERGVRGKQSGKATRYEFARTGAKA